MTYLVMLSSVKVVFCKKAHIGCNVSKSSLRTMKLNDADPDSMKIVPTNSPSIVKLLLIFSNTFCLFFIQCKQYIDTTQSYFSSGIKSSAKQCSKVRLSISL